MRKIKRMITVLIAAAVSVAAMVSTAFTASAVGVFDNAIPMEPMTYYSYQFGEDETVYFKITLKSSGTLKLFCENNTGNWYGGPRYTLIDESMNQYDDGQLSKNYSKEIKELSKGTYYFKFYAPGPDMSFTNVYYSFVSDGKTPADEPDDEPTAVIALRLKKGDTARVTVVTNDYDGSIRWTSTKKSVATVSKGKITAKKKGNARIRAYLDDGSYTEILVIVEN